MEKDIRELLKESTSNEGLDLFIIEYRMNCIAYKYNVELEDVDKMMREIYDKEFRDE